MSEPYLDDLFDQLVTDAPRPAWDDVLGRARRSRRRYGVLVAVAALFVLVPAAWAIDNAFFGSPPPPEVVAGAEWSNKLAPQAQAYAEANGWPNPGQYGVTADISQLHGLFQVQTADGPLDLWGAPASDGGLCVSMAYEANLNVPPGVMNHYKGAGGADCYRPDQVTPTTVSRDSPYIDHYLIYAYMGHPGATSAEVTFKVGDEVRTLTSPVVEGFLLAVTPRDPSSTDAWDIANTGIDKIVTYDASGNELETWLNPWKIPCPKPFGEGPCDPRTP